MPADGTGECCHVAGRTMVCLVGHSAVGDGGRGLVGRWSRCGSTAKDRPRHDRDRHDHEHDNGPRQRLTRHAAHWDGSLRLRIDGACRIVGWFDRGVHTVLVPRQLSEVPDYLAVGKSPSWTARASTRRLRSGTAISTDSVPTRVPRIRRQRPGVALRLERGGARTVAHPSRAVIPRPSFVPPAAQPPLRPARERLSSGSCR